MRTPLIPLNPLEAPGDPGEPREAVEVAFTVLRVEPVRGAGRLVAVAVVELDFAGVVLVLQGVQAIRHPDGTLECRAPTWRHPASGKWLPATVMPPELSAAIAAEVLPLAAQEAR